MRQHGLIPYTKPQLLTLNHHLLTLGYLDFKAAAERKTLLTLPGEIRNKIYELVQEQCAVATITWTTPLTLPARLAQVCRQI
ncbi:hypothetical protein CLAFUW4_12689 [Fulvia fulva]|uniref:Uncharacterized protein n=1 Tax=Passalora fulva TaxID=5499 RepID=A0A9Q8UV64_PASFU|nr:uncharacterized protein CLAFUR5_12554 [Fulvia fulva]KAK4612028.1 hypothetical protein CLAFUR4_12694 [Fulvia fulva]KAK4612738.1 hypothetical protein CLAFUR0_12700 [Fulvia fulva]UJO23547.1 hypothetical protein CLAFUR5_12554 [Fulvia fulva]WPV21558.1 hypothetical protein CLAFUW4_12689 [Fulvia fulva]WPV36589.1 hypothetical protein CLAFUW7_12696 [Fulvia fulva]